MSEVDNIAQVYDQIIKILETNKISNKECIHLAKELELAGLQGIMIQVAKDASNKK